MKTKKLPRGVVAYSEKIEGARGNYRWPARFDIQDGFVGVTQFKGNGAYKERVLLSPIQFKALRDFVARHT